jgi:hypothetical protein
MCHITSLCGLLVACRKLRGASSYKKLSPHPSAGFMEIPLTSGWFSGTLHLVSYFDESMLLSQARPNNHPLANS